MNANSDITAKLDLLEKKYREDTERLNRKIASLERETMELKQSGLSIKTASNKPALSGEAIDSFAEDVISKGWLVRSEKKAFVTAIVNDPDSIFPVFEKLSSDGGAFNVAGSVQEDKDVDINDGLDPLDRAVLGM